MLIGPLILQGTLKKSLQLENIPKLTSVQNSRKLSVSLGRNPTCICDITSSCHTAITQVKLTLGTMVGDVIPLWYKTS